MATYTATVTGYNGVEDRVSRGLRLDQAILKVQRNIYGHDDAELIASLIVERCSEKGRATFFCTMNTAQVEIKLEG